MPTYEYRCKDCGEQLEVVQSFRDDPLTVCPRCTGPLKKVFQPVGIAFKGQGFYRNDARSASSATAGAAKAPADASSSSDSSSGSSDSSSGGSSDSSSGSSSDSSSSSGTPSKATSA